jgi:cell wall integrity and stress response component
VAGIVLGVVFGIAALVGLAFFIWRRKRQQQRQHDVPETAFVPRTGTTSPSTHTPSRQVSQLSSSGLLGGPKLPRINTSGPLAGGDPRSADTSGSGGYDRRSVATDQRLNPYALYLQQEGRASNMSLQDNHDYSRQLRVRK